MKRPYAILIAAAAAWGLLLWLGRICYSPLEPPGHLLPSMDAPPARPPCPPPPGAVPHESSAGAGRPSPGAAELFARSCAACHGASGDAKSYVAAQPGMPEVNNLTTGDVTPEELYRTLTEGRGAMPAHASRLSEADRRRLIHFITHTLRKP